MEDQSCVAAHALVGLRAVAGGTGGVAGGIDTGAAQLVGDHVIRAGRDAHALGVEEVATLAGQAVIGVDAVEAVCHTRLALLGREIEVVLVMAGLRALPIHRSGEIERTGGAAVRTIAGVAVGGARLAAVGGRVAVKPVCASGDAESRLLLALPHSLGLQEVALVTSGARDLVAAFPAPSGTAAALLSAVIVVTPRGAVPAASDVHDTFAVLQGVAGETRSALVRLLPTALRTRLVAETALQSPAVKVLSLGAVRSQDAGAIPQLELSRTVGAAGVTHSTAAEAGVVARKTRAIGSGKRQFGARRSAEPGGQLQGSVPAPDARFVVLALGTQERTAPAHVVVGVGALGASLHALQRGSHAEVFAGVAELRAGFRTAPLAFRVALGRDATNRKVRLPRTVQHQLEGL